MISIGFTISTICSLQFAAVNRNNVKDAVLVHRVVWAINNVEIYWDLTVINFIIIPRFLLLIYSVMQSLDRQKSQTLPSQIYRLYHRKMEKIKRLKLDCIIN